MVALVSLGFFTLLACVITYFGYRMYARPGRIYEHLGDAALPALDKGGGDAIGLPVRVLQTIGQALPGAPEDANVVRRDLIAAGYRSDSAVTIFFGIRVLACAALVLVGFLIRTYLIDNFVLGIVVMVACGFAGWFGPSLILESMASARQDRLRK